MRRQQCLEMRDAEQEGQIRVQDLSITERHLCFDGFIYIHLFPDPSCGCKSLVETVSHKQVTKLNKGLMFLPVQRLKPSPIMLQSAGIPSGLGFQVK